MAKLESRDLAELRRLAETAGHDADRSRHAARLAIALRDSRRFAEALAAARTAADLFGAVDEPALQAVMLMLVGEMLVAVHRHDAAAHRLAEARHALEAAHASPAFITHCERVLADVARHRERLDEAERWLASACDRYAQAGAVGSAARCEHDLGVLHHQAGDPQRAVATLRSAHATLLDLRDREGVAACGYNLGVASHDAGAHDDAIEHYQQARSIFEAVERLADAAACDQNIAAVLFSTGQIEAAGQRLMVAQAAYRALGLARRAAECDAGLAQVLRASGRDDMASAYLARARSEGVEDPADHAPASA